MTKLAKRESFFEDLFDFRREFDELFNRLTTGLPFSTELAPRMLPRVPPVEAWVDSKTKRYHLRVALPGIDPDSVQLNLQGNMLTISAERKESRETKEVNYLHRELSYGTVERTLTLPEGVETDKINAEYQNGVLEITAPMASAALPRRIEIKGLPKAKGVGG